MDFCAAIPVLTITGSYGFSIDQALESARLAERTPMKIIEMLQPIVAARREQARRTT